MIDALSVVATGLATAGTITLGWLAFRDGEGAARRFSALCFALALWSASLLARLLFPGLASQALVWCCAMILPPVGFHFVAAQGSFASRLLERVAWVLWLPSLICAVLLFHLGEAVLPAVALYLFPALIAAVVCLFLQESRGREAGAERRFRPLATGGIVASVLTGLDVLPLFGVEGLQTPSLAPLGALVLVAFMGASVSRHSVYRIRPPIGGGVALLACAVAAAALVLWPAEQQAGDAKRRLLWATLVIVGCLAIQVPLMRFLRAPFSRQRDRARGQLLTCLDAMDAVFASQVDEAGLRQGFVDALLHCPVVRDAWVHDEHQALTAGDLPLQALGEPVGSWGLRLDDPGLRDDEEVADSLTSVSRRLATTLRALRLYQEAHHNQSLARLGVLATGIAHEIKNPLAAILGAVDLLEKEAPGDGSRKWLRIVQEESRRVSQFVSEVLAYGRVPDPRVEELELHAFLDEVVRWLEPQARNQGVALEVTRCDQTMRVRWDPEQMRHVLGNLVSNALQAVGSQGGRVELWALGRNSGVELHLADSGPGIDDDARAKVFDPFFTTRADGTGLGLAIAHRIVEAHHGRLSLMERAAELGGAHFVLQWPVTRYAHDRGKETS